MREALPAMENVANRAPSAELLALPLNRGRR